MVIEHIHVWKSVSTEKFAAGPISCRPGPMLFSYRTDADALAALGKS